MKLCESIFICVSDAISGKFIVIIVVQPSFTLSAIKRHFNNLFDKQFRSLALTFIYDVVKRDKYGTLNV